MGKKDTDAMPLALRMEEGATRLFQVVLVVKNPPANTGDVKDTGLVPGSGRSPGGGHGNPLCYSCLESPIRQRSLAGCSP